jgi:membrane-bound lytic murein transglycosylase D
MIAATIIAKNPEKFGFKNVPYLPPMAVDKVQVNEPTSLKAAAVAVNVPVEEVQALNPELLRGITPPDNPSYALNLPAKGKEAFAKNISLARIEHPAVASRPTRVAKSAASSRRSSAAKAPERVQVRASTKADKKSKTTAKKAGKQGKVQVAATKKGKTGHHPPEKVAAATRTASMLPLSPPSKSGHKDKGKAQVASHDTKGKAKGQAKEKAHGKTSGAQQPSKKADTTAKSSKSGKSSTSANRSKAKGKISKSPSSALLVSEAR